MSYAVAMSSCQDWGKNVEQFFASDSFTELAL
jgi:hypothetical protein